MVERARSVQDVPRPLWAFVEIGHPYNYNDQGGSNPHQVEGAVWASIIGGVRGICYFHHNFAQTDEEGVVPPPTWNSATDYREGQCVAYDGKWYYAALKPAIGQVPSDSSYTWSRWDQNSGAGIENDTGRHPDLLAKLLKIKTDLIAMAPAINSPITPHFCHKDVYSSYRPDAHDGKKYIFALPGLGAPQGGTFSMYLPAGQNPSSIEVIGEGRTITPVGGKFTDTFAAEYSHHIYRW